MSKETKSKTANKSENKSPSSEVEILKNQPKSQHGGARAGAGKPLGQISDHVSRRRLELQKYRERVIQNTDKIFNAQFANAIGNMYVYRVEEGKDKKKKHVLVDDPIQIKEVLDQNQGGSGTVDGEYYIVTTQKPDNNAIKDMLDRTYGTATQTIVTEDEMNNKKPINQIDLSNLSTDQLKVIQQIFPK
jgi:hypothetical protein